MSRTPSSSARRSTATASPASGRRGVPSGALDAVDSRIAPSPSGGIIRPSASRRGPTRSRNSGSEGARALPSGPAPTFGPPPLA